MTRKSQPVARVCKVDGCTARETYTRGLCALHWCSRSDLADPVPEIAGPSSLKTATRAELGARVKIRY